MSSQSSRGKGAAVALGLGGFLVYSIAKASNTNARRRNELGAAFANQVRTAGDLLGRVAPSVAMTNKVSNAASDGERILVNTRWVDEVLRRYCSNDVCSTAVLLGVAAHELSHHYWQHALTQNPFSAHNDELVADRDAGRVLRMAGIPSEDFERVIADLSGLGSSTHPAGLERARAIQAGFHGGVFF